MSFEELPRDLEASVQRFARQQHISQDEAVLKLIEVGLSIVAAENESSTAANDIETANVEDVLAAATSARRRRTEARQVHRERLAEARPDAPDALIGYLGDAPEVAESIRKLAIERRNQAFGSL